MSKQAKARMALDKFHWAILSTRRTSAEYTTDTCTPPPGATAPSPEKAQLLCITAASCCGPGGGGSSQAGTEVSFVVFHPDQTHHHKPPKPTLLLLLLLLLLAPLSTSPLHTGCPHLSRRQLSIISVSQNPAGAHCARGRRRRQALGGSGGPQMESALSIIVTNY
ncbi:unnamed protein product [Leuciscus chuanchicus]